MEFREFRPSAESSLDLESPAQPSAGRPPMVAPPRSVGREPSGSHRDSTNLVGGFFWLFATSSLVLAAWFVGPVVVQRYQYAATRGRVLAEYEHAVTALENDPLNGVSKAYQLVATKIRPSVVSVSASTGRHGGQGSGVIFSKDGYLVTNEHVVRGARHIDVILHDRRKYVARVIGTDTMNDMAVLKIDVPGDLIPAKWGDSDLLRVGSMVWAVGSPYGLDQTVTSGILSAKERAQQRNSQEFLQTDAAVNPGNSGGPLVNAQGEVVGINTSIYGEQFQGISFAVPSCVAKYVYEQLRDHGRVSRGFLGVIPEAVMHMDMMQLGVPDLNGAVVRNVRRGTPADSSGLQVNDVIRCWNGNPIKAFSNLYRYVAMTKPNTAAEVEIYRDGKEMKLDVLVRERPLDLDPQ